MTPQVGAYLTIVINDHIILIVEATGCCVTFDLHMMTRGVIYAPKFVNYAPRVVSYAPRVVSYAPRVFSYAPRVIHSDHRVINSAPRVINYAPREKFIVQAHLR